MSLHKSVLLTNTATAAATTAIVASTSGKPTVHTGSSSTITSSSSCNSLNTTYSSSSNSNNNFKKTYIIDHLKPPVNSLTTTNSTTNKKQSTNFTAIDKAAMSNFANDFNSFKQISQQLSNATATTSDHTLGKFKDITTNILNYNNGNNCMETTYVLNSPPVAPKPSMPTLYINDCQSSSAASSASSNNYEVTPLQAPKL